MHQGTKGRVMETPLTPRSLLCATQFKGLRTCGLLVSVILIAASAAATDATHAENLNKKFGPEWNCSRIGHGRAELDALHKACLACERQSRDFFQTGPDAGYCVPRTGGAQPTSASPSKRRASSMSPAKPTSAPKQLWCVIAAGIEESFTHQQAAVGVGDNLATKQMAEEEALSNCAKGGFAGCSVKLSWNSGAAT